MSLFSCSKTDFFGLYKRASFDSTGRVVFRKKEKSAIEKAGGFQSPNQIFFPSNRNINATIPQFCTQKQIAKPNFTYQTKSVIHQT
jgi:hypothetical protein